MENWTTEALLEEMRGLAQLDRDESLLAQIVAELDRRKLIGAPIMDPKYAPDPDDLLDAADELRALADAYKVDTEGPSRLLEQTAIALLPEGTVRDQLLEGRTDLGEEPTR